MSMSLELVNVWKQDMLDNMDKQGKGDLYNEETGCYCALGRLCKVLGMSDEVLLKCDIPYNLLRDEFNISEDFIEKTYILNDGAENGCQYSVVINYIDNNLEKFVK